MGNVKVAIFPIQTGPDFLSEIGRKRGLGRFQDDVGWSRPGGRSSSRWYVVMWEGRRRSTKEPGGGPGGIPGGNQLTRGSARLPGRIPGCLIYGGYYRGSGGRGAKEAPN